MNHRAGAAPDEKEPRRGGPSAWGDRLIRRLGLAGMLLANSAIVVGDFVTAPHRPFAFGFTATETVLLVPWAWVVFRLGAHEVPVRPRRRGQHLRPLAVHLVNGLLLAGCMIWKWLAVLEVDGYAGDLLLSQYRMFTVAAYVLVNVGLLGRGARASRLLGGLSQQPARMTALSFGLTGLFGALLLNLPPALRDPADASFVDSLFTAISAVCVTGLVVHPTAQTYTPFGQAVILCLFQVGGLGIMGLSAAFATLAGRRLRLRSSVMIAEMVDARSLASLRRTLKGIVGYTLAIELVGAVLLYLMFLSYPATTLGPESTGLAAGAGSRVWAAVFHSVSAFCNAGFTVFHGGALAFAGSWPVSLTLMVLIVLGGLGFPVLRELGVRAQVRLARRRVERMSLHSRVVLWTSGSLIGAGALAILALEWSGVMAPLPWDDRFLTALFQSTTRTAGFNTLPIDAMAAPTLMLLCMLMFIGASPGSTGGGVKTTTLAVLFATFRAELFGRRTARLGDRSVGEAVARRAMGVFFLSVVIVSFLLLVLLIAEPHDPLALAFEAFSAFATTGLSTGITPHLSTPGKLLITFTMFIGRIGPLTLAIALAARQRRQAFHLPEERVTIG
ncbi:MAG: TrkH family potassium uptake protein [Myxococcota bacterium]